MKIVQVKHADAAQGGKEERVSRTGSTVNERETPADTVMRHKHQRSFWLRQKAG